MGHVGFKLSIDLKLKSPDRGLATFRWSVSSMTPWGTSPISLQKHTKLRG